MKKNKIKLDAKEPLHHYHYLMQKWITYVVDNNTGLVKRWVDYYSKYLPPDPDDFFQKVYPYTREVIDIDTENFPPFKMNITYEIKNFEKTSKITAINFRGMTYELTIRLAGGWAVEEILIKQPLWRFGRGKKYKYVQKLKSIFMRNHNDLIIMQGGATS